MGGGEVSKIGSTGFGRWCQCCRGWVQEWLYRPMLDFQAHIWHTKIVLEGLCRYFKFIVCFALLRLTAPILKRSASKDRKKSFSPLACYLVRALSLILSCYLILTRFPRYRMWKASRISTFNIALMFIQVLPLLPRIGPRCLYSKARSQLHTESHEDLSSCLN